ncbi:hypothetical protein HOY82DRAFT_486045 [Tuber indicum]|nr:hypothetical protein HOY82DRAFT_486045 [Tuber indicum]
MLGWLGVGCSLWLAGCLLLPHSLTSASCQQNDSGASSSGNSGGPYLLWWSTPLSLHTPTGLCPLSSSSHPVLFFCLAEAAVSDVIRTLSPIDKTVAAGRLQHRMPDSVGERVQLTSCRR